MNWCIPAKKTSVPKLRPSEKSQMVTFQQIRAARRPYKELSVYIFDGWSKGDWKLPLVYH